MSIKDMILNLLHKLDKVCSFVLAIVNSIGLFLTGVKNKIDIIYLNFFFDSLTISGVEYFERLLKITPGINQTLDDRRAQVRAKWMQDGHNSIVLIQLVCDSWKYGEIEADFIEGKLKLQFVSSYGIPDDLEGLKNAVNEVKPTYIPYDLRYKYLLIKDIHEVMTLEELENTKINDFSFGIGE